MTHLIRLTGFRLLAAATAFGAAGPLMVSPGAQAQPWLPVPLAPACSQYRFNGNFSLKQSNGDTVVFSSIGSTASGNASATGGRNGPLHGTVTGGIQGDKLQFVITWGPNSEGNYTGFVSSDGFAHGDTADSYQPFGDGPGSYAHWDSTVPLVCDTPAAAPPAAPPQNPLLTEQATPVPNRRSVPFAATAQQATVTSDVDVYDSPGGTGNKIGILRSGRQVQLVAACKPNDWCDVVIPELAGGSGWVWDQFLQFF